MRAPAPRTLRLALLGGLSLALLAWLAARGVEHAIRSAMLRRERPFRASVERVHFSWFGRARLEGLRLDAGSGLAGRCDRVWVEWTPFAGLRLLDHVRSVSFEGLAVAEQGLELLSPASKWAVETWREQPDVQVLRLAESPTGELQARWRNSGDGQTLELVTPRLDLGSLGRVSWNGRLLLQPGVWSGTLRLARRGEHAETTGTLQAEGLRMALPEDGAAGALGAPMALAVTWELVRDGVTTELRRCQVSGAGSELRAQGRFAGAGAASAGGADPGIALDVTLRVDLAGALRSTGLELPARLGIAPTTALGTATLDVAWRGNALDPAQEQIAPRLQYQAPASARSAFQYLNGPFTHTNADSQHPPLQIDVSEGAPDFMPIGEVPALFLRALLISEDSNFYGHPGIDVSEIPVAWAANRAHGGPLRGASTISQQLVKNLFLSRDKSYGRKLREAVLALLVDASVPKQRLLEIYLNVIEWGPGLHGLRPAARHYFGKEPQRLTPREMVFLVCLIPSPVRYHEAHRAQQVGPGMDQLLANLLVKLRSVDALDEAAYEQALHEDLRFLPEGDDPDPTEAPLEPAGESEPPAPVDLPVG